MPNFFLQLELIQKAQVYASDDPNFFIMYIRDDESASGSASVGGSGSGGGSGEGVSENESGSGNPLKCSAIVSSGRDERGAATCTFWVYIYLFLFSLPYLFSWGLQGFVDFLLTAHYDMFHVKLYPEMADHLGVKVADTLQLEYLASTVGEFGKGHGSKLMKVLKNCRSVHGSFVGKCRVGL